MSNIKRDYGIRDFKDKSLTEVFIEYQEKIAQIDECVLSCMISDIITDKNIQIKIDNFKLGAFLYSNYVIQIFPYIYGEVKSMLDGYSVKHKGTKMDLEADFIVFKSIYVTEYDEDNNENYDKDTLTRMTDFYGVTRRTLLDRQVLFKKMIKKIETQVYDHLSLSDSVNLVLHQLDFSVMLFYSIYKYFGFSDQAYGHLSKYMMNVIMLP